MWDAFLARLTGAPQQSDLPEPDDKLALAALLVRVAKSDSFYHVAEIVEIDQILAAGFDMNPVEAARLRATAEKLEAQAPDTQKFAQIVCESVDYAQRLS
ncbi:MAG: tellurite resistance TerB family protein, partial [Cognatishimia sp.]|uniref:tellurite resistance TerB family protein n=1 Tax=Cognatishimia sp. TaxID=2211648 RepID=UPI0040597D27